MKIFLSYASEDRDMAEAVVHSLRGRKHTVFLDRSDLPPGGSYEDRIEAAIQASDVLVFLISRHSVARGRFTLTELAIAERRWPHADGRVLPVRINSDAVSMDEIPTYLRAVTILEPAGNIAAETAIAVSALATPWLKRPTIVGGALAITAAAIFALWSMVPGSSVVVTTLPPVSLEPGYLDVPARVLLRYKVANQGRTTAELRGLEPVSDPPGALSLSRGYDDPTTVGPDQLLPDEVRGNQFWAELAADAPDTFSYKICAKVVDSGVHCSVTSLWRLTSGIESVGEWGTHTSFRLPVEISTKATAVVHDGEDFLLTTRSPAQIHRISSSGEIVASAELPAEPVALSSGPHGLLVGTQGPDLLLRLNADLVETARHEIALSPTVSGTFEDPISTRTVSIAQDAEQIALITRGGAAASALLFVSSDLREIRLPDYFADIEFDLRDMRLSADAASRGFWGTQTNTTPASLYSLHPDTVHVFSGHDYDVVACASDVLAVHDGLLIPDCDGNLVKLDVTNNRLSIKNRLGRLRDFPASVGTWSTVSLAASDELLVAAVENGPIGDEIAEQTKLTVLGGGADPLPQTYRASLVGLAAAPHAKLLILENSSGKRDTVATPH